MHKHKKYQQATTNAEVAKIDVEVIQVTGGFGANLRSALNTKKSSSTIEDGISADDILSLPALNMGEALQAVPGVQLNREGGRRESSVNLRGLPSSFALTTVNGQTIATPTRNGSGNAYGAGNPFGAYNPAVFSGISVLKSQTAEMQEGGISGTVNQKLRGALSRKDSLQVSVGARYEELSDSYDLEYIVSSSKHLIQYVLAFNATLAYSEQTFRQDLIKINAYDSMTSTNFDKGTGNTGTFEEWKADNGLASDAIIKIPGEYRQQSETNSGDRTSFSAGIEYKPSEDLVFGFDTIHTKRELDGSRLEQLEMRLDYSSVDITPLAEFGPRETGEIGKNGETVYALSGVDFNNARYYFDNRQDSQLQESEAYLFDATWFVNNWTFDAAITTSEATNERNEVLLSSRINNSGVNGTVYTGEGDIGDFYFDMENADTAMDLDNAVWNVKDAVANTALVGADNGVYMIITGNYEKVEQDSDAVAN